MKIEIEVDIENNEGTSSPWWGIIDPKQNMRMDIHEVANQITGPYFSRAEAQAYLDGRRYNFSHRARVYCFSGCYSWRYDTAFRGAEKKAKEETK